MGAIGVIIGLYIVLWGKAKDVEEIKEVEIDEDSKKNDLQQPLLCDDTMKCSDKVWRNGPHLGLGLGVGPLDVWCNL